MADKDIKALLLKWAKRDGEHVVKGILIGKRMSTSLIDQLLSQRYSGVVRGTNLTVIEDELRKAGLIESQDEAG